MEKSLFNTGRFASVQCTVAMTSHTVQRWSISVRTFERDTNIRFSERLVIKMSCFGDTMALACPPGDMVAVHHSPDKAPVYILPEHFCVCVCVFVPWF